MDAAVGIVQAYLRVNGYLTVAEYPVLEAARAGGYRTATDLDILAIRFPRAGRLVAGVDLEGGRFEPDPALGCPPLYIVERGPEPGSLDRGLGARAESLGVRVRFGRRVDPDELGGDVIVATGPRGVSDSMAVTRPQRPQAPRHG